FDAVIVAIGSKPIIPGFTQGNPKIVWVGDVEMGRTEVGQDLVIVGAGLTGCESALALSREGKNVTLVDMIPEENFGRGGAMFNQIAMKNLLKDSNVKFRGGMKLVTVEDEAVFEDANTGEKVTFPCDQVILSLGVRPDAELVESFADVCPEVVWIGDCNTRVGTLYNAVHTAHEAAAVI
nr:NAD(P)/FAD-dependent oxidoreductase [Lachnospiraceae bacterium]